MKTIIAIAIGMLLSTSVALGQNNNDYSKTLHTMFKVAGTEDTYKVVLTQMMTMVKEQYSDIEASAWNDLEEEFMKTSLEDLVAMLAPVYQKYLTQKDLEAIIQFYQTPAGKKFAKSTPLIAQESMQVGEEWGRKIGKKIVKKIEQKSF